MNIFKPSLVNLVVLTSALFVAALSHADHQKDNPSDGTVASFKQVKPARYLEPVNFYNNLGAQVNFNDYKGKVILVNVWATWCGPCLRELPELDRLKDKFKDTDFVLLPISIDDEGLELVSGFYQQLDIKHLDMFIDTDKQLGKIFPVDAVPATFILNRQGKVTSYLRSYANWDDDAAFNMIMDNIASVPYRLPEIVNNN
ncbi:hypothetical protein A9Q98_08625 [Thalassotalea sp. 42_200_T64]|nr:hypothetical protein A9Q98_08625 [Thalassotalea sp. 42_200_T64]